MTPERTDELAAVIAATAEQARRIAGGNYDKTIRPWRDFIECTMAVYDCEPLMAVPMVINEFRGKAYGAAGYYDDDDARIWLTAAAVDVMEGQARD